MASAPKEAVKRSFSERLKSLTKKVEEAKDAASSLTPEEAKRRKLEGIKKRRLEERKAKALEAAKERSKTAADRARDVVLYAIKHGILDWKLKKIDLSKEPVGVGTHYHSWLLEVQGEGKFIVKDLQDRGDELRQVLAISHEREYNFQAAAGRVGIGFLTPYYVTENGTMLMHRFHPTATRCSKDFVTSKYRMVLELIKKLHGMETTGLQRFFPYNVFSDIEDCAKAAQDRKLPLPDSFPQMLQIAMQWRDILGQNPVDSTMKYYVCHNNLHHSNIFHVPPETNDPMKKDGRLYLADFKHAALGDRYYDLATFSRLNGFGNDEDVLLMKYYFGTYTERQMACMKLLKVVGYLRDGLVATLTHALVPGFKDHDSLPQQAVELMGQFESKAMSQEFAMYIGNELMR